MTTPQEHAHSGPGDGGETLKGVTLEDNDGSSLPDTSVASGNVTLSSGSATIDTGVSDTSASFMLALGVQDPDADAKAAGKVFWDDSAGTHKVQIDESGTSVGNPTVNYDIIRVS